MIKATYIDHMGSDSCDWVIDSYYRRGSEDMNVWLCRTCKKSLWLWESDGEPVSCIMECAE